MKAPNSAKTVKHLKNNNGSWAYRRRVPQKMHKTLGITMWNLPCGKVSYARAVAMVADWTEEHDALIAQLDDPTIALEVRQTTEAQAMAPRVEAVIYDHTNGLLQTADPLAYARDGMPWVENNPSFDAQDRLVRYRAQLASSFGPHVVPPTDPDERDEFDLIRRKLERRIAEIAGDPNTITAVAERYYDFSGVKIGVRKKYRRNINKLIKHVGDVPLPHLTARQLREFRDVQAKTMQASSLHSVFTPIKGMLGYAVEEDIIDINPMGSVRLQKEKRSINQRKWKRFTPVEAQRIFEAMDKFWLSPLRGVSDDRRLAVWWAVRVQAFTAMRPKEVVSLEPADVSDSWIKVHDSKTSDSDRTIPLHPELKGFPAFVHAGGFDCLKSQTKDRVQSVRHNFERLLRDFMDPPIDDPKKVLYSWRTSFSNSMASAGATPDMRRAILGHAEAGALKHYDDGPEFAKKRKAVSASDCRTEYPDNEDDELS